MKAVSCRNRRSRMPTKFETLILDMVYMMDNCLPFEVEREKEFAPVKNALGTDSVESARELLKKNGIAI